MTTVETGPATAPANGGAAYPLDHLRVLDLARVLSGPFAGRMLSDLGADVVKVEPPEGDVTRTWGNVVGGLPGYFQQHNAGKRNISLDLRAPGARDLVLDLVRHTDIVIENFRPDVLPRLGLGYDAMQAANPRVIMLSISGFGHNGPDSHRPAYAPVIHAEVGLIRRGAERSGGAHHDLPLSVADTNAGLHGLVALLAAVIMRERTGVGQHIDLAMIDATVATDDMLHFELENSVHTAPRPNEVWETGAGPVIVSNTFGAVWRLVTTKLGVVDPTDESMEREERFRVRRRIFGEFMAGLASWEQVDSVMGGINVPYGRVASGATILDHATVRHRGSIVQVDDRAGGTRPVTQSPYRFSAARSGVRGPASHRGEHNRDVLTEWLDLPAAEIDALVAQGVLVHDKAYVQH